MFDRRKNRRKRENRPSTNIEGGAGTDAGSLETGDAEMNMMSKVELSTSTHSSCVSILAAFETYRSARSRYYSFDDVPEGQAHSTRV